MSNPLSDLPIELDDVDASTPDGFPDALLAERYLGGDMSPEVADAFENGLDSPELLEQLVASVQTRDALGESSSAVLRPSYRQPARLLRRSVLCVVAAALCAVFAFVLQPSRPAGTEVVVDESPTRDLAPVWVELSGQDESFRNIDAQLAEFDRFEANSFETLSTNRVGGVDRDIVDEVTNVPDWMFAAIALPSDESDLLEGAL